MSVYGKIKIKSCNFKYTHDDLLMEKITKLWEKISCKPTNSHNLAGMPTLHLLEAARILPCSPAGGELQPSPSDEGETGQKMPLTTWQHPRPTVRERRSPPQLPVPPRCLRARTTGTCFWWAQISAGAFRLHSGGWQLTRGNFSCRGSAGRWRQLH